LDDKAVSDKVEQRYSELLGTLRWFIAEARADEALRLACSLAEVTTAPPRRGRQD